MWETENTDGLGHNSSCWFGSEEFSECLTSFSYHDAKVELKPVCGERGCLWRWWIICSRSGSAGRSDNDLLKSQHLQSCLIVWLESCRADGRRMLMHSQENIDFHSCWVSSVDRHTRKGSPLNKSECTFRVIRCPLYSSSPADTDQSARPAEGSALWDSGVISRFYWPFTFLLHTDDLLKDAATIAPFSSLDLMKTLGIKEQ